MKELLGWLATIAVAFVLAVMVLNLAAYLAFGLPIWRF